MKFLCKNNYYFSLHKNNKPLFHQINKSKINKISSKSMMNDEKISSSKNKNLLIVGPGVLGSYLGKICIDEGFKVSGYTMTTKHHSRSHQTQLLNSLLLYNPCCSID